MGLYIQETWIDRSGHSVIGDSDIYESRMETKSEVFRACLKSYGRCMGRVYIDGDGKPIPIGWSFEKRDRYEDDVSKTFIKETWVTLHARPATRTVKHHYLRADTGVEV